MYPNIFVQNVQTGSSTNHCDCCAKYGSKEEKIRPGKSGKFSSNQAVNRSEEKLACTSDSIAMKQWFQQIGKYMPHRPLSMPAALYDHYMALPSPPYTPRLSSSSSSSDESDRELRKHANGLNLLVAAIDYIENCTASNSRKCSTMWTAEFDVEFFNLFMLADEAVKRIEARTITKM